MRENYIDRFIMIDIEKFVTITNANGYVNDDFKRFRFKEKTDDKLLLITFTGTFNNNVPQLDIDQSPIYLLQGLSILFK